MKRPKFVRQAYKDAQLHQRNFLSHRRLCRLWNNLYSFNGFTYARDICKRDRLIDMYARRIKQSLKRECKSGEYANSRGWYPTLLHGWRDIFNRD